MANKGGGQRKWNPRNRVGPKQVLWIKELPKIPSGERTGIFQCNKCGAPFYSDLGKVVGYDRRYKIPYIRQYCPRCAKVEARKKMSRHHTKYKVGQEIGPNHILMIDRFPSPYGTPKDDYGTFICPICEKEFDYELQAVSKGNISMCPECLKTYKASSEIGETFGNWVITNYVGRDEQGRSVYLCQCQHCRKHYEPYAFDDLVGGNVPDMCEECLKEKTEETEENIGENCTTARDN